MNEEKVMSGVMNLLEAEPAPAALPYISPELRHGSHFCVVFWTFFLKFSLFPKILAFNCLFLCKMIFFSDNLLHMSCHVIDHALN